MNTVLGKILDWSEVWALLIPLIIVLKYRNQPSRLKPVKIYIWLSFFIFLFADIIMEFKKPWHFPSWLRTNNYLYNAHAIIQLFLFIWFFNLLVQPFLKTAKRVIPLLACIFIIINFLFFEDFFERMRLSSLMLAVAAGILLFYCLQYYLYLLMDEQIRVIRKVPGFWIVTGLSVYVVINFFIFLFYEALIVNNMDFAVEVWNIHNLTFIIFCICMSIEFYKGQSYGY